MKIGQSIKHIRKTKSKQNQFDFAQSIGITQAYLSRIENDHCKPTLDVLERVSDHCGVPISIVLWFGVVEDDIHEDKRQIFRVLKPTIDGMMDQIIKN
jgi:XRE family transcriptional regulator, regulator of sulfur utilization